MGVTESVVSLTKLFDMLMAFPKGSLENIDFEKNSHTTNSSEKLEGNDCVCGRLDPNTF